MSNIYHFTACEHCKKFTCSSQQGTFFIRGSLALVRLAELGGTDQTPEQVAANFCGYCGGVVADKDRSGACCSAPEKQTLQQSV